MSIRVICVCSLLALGTLWAGEEKSAEPDRTEPKSISIATYNVCERPIEEDKRVPALLKLLSESKADLIALQETQPWFMELLGKEEWTKAYKIAHPETKSGAHCELCILSKLPLAKVEYLELPSRLGRGALIIQCKTGTQTLTLATVHLDSFLEDGPMRAKQLEAVFAKLKDSGEAILLGDFNFGDGEKESASLDAGYTDAWTTLHPKDPGFTWNIETSPMARQGSFPEEKSRRLDRILVRSAHWKPKEAIILGDKPVSEKDKDVFPSDHFGVLATLEVRP